MPYYVYNTEYVVLIRKNYFLSLVSSWRKIVKMWRYCMVVDNSEAFASELLEDLEEMFQWHR